MGFVRTPLFINSASVWHAPNVPPAAPDLVVDCQLYFTPKGQWPILAGDNTQWPPPVYLRVPKGTDLRVGDTVEVSGWTYLVRWTERVHLGMINEYFAGILEQQGTPAPPPPGPQVLTWFNTSPGQQIDSLIPPGPGFVVLLAAAIGPFPTSVFTGFTPSATLVGSSPGSMIHGGADTFEFVYEIWQVAGGETLTVASSTNPLSIPQAFAVYIPAAVALDSNGQNGAGGGAFTVTTSAPTSVPNNVAVAFIFAVQTGSSEVITSPFAVNLGPAFPASSVTSNDGTNWFLAGSWAQYGSGVTPAFTFTPDVVATINAQGVIVVIQL